MFLGLKGALGRNPMLNRVGQKLLQSFGGASAAYSLRNLASNIASVVRVRRASDNSERDFSAEDISSGAMTQWVNGQVVPPLDIRELDSNGERTGSLVAAAAAYSLRNLSTNYTGNVVNARRNTDGATLDFSAAEVADGTLTNWVNTSFANALPLDTASGAAAAYSLRNLSTSYTGNVVDVRRSSDDAEDSFTAAEVADGTLTTWVSEAPIAQNSTSNPYTTFTNASNTGFTVTLSSATAYAGFGSVSGSSGDSVTISFDLDVVSGSPFVALREGTGLIDSRSNSQVYSSSGSYSLTMTATGNFGFIGFSEGDIPSEFTVSNFEITSVSGATYVRDGFVTQWYDQSGNANHATQGTDASQPKIVDAGSLVSGGLDFDGSDDYLQYNYDIANPTSGSIFAVFNNTATSDTGIVFGVRSSTRDLVQLTAQSEEEDRLQVRDSGNSIVQVIADNGSRLNEHLTSAVFAKSTPIYDIDINGGLVSASDSTSLSGTITASKATIGATDSGSIGGLFSGKIREIIYYNSDQSDKRRAIEENIGSNYGITLTSSKDGTVSTWYDQSGNTNHATQTDAASQPKIVSGGTLVSGGLDFDGVDDFFEATNPIDGATSHTSISVIKPSQAGRIMSLKEDGRSDENWRMFVSLSNNVGYAHDDGTAYTAQTAITLGNNALVFGSYDASDLKISLNGNTPVTSSVSGFTLNTTGDLQIGRNAQTGTNIYGGTFQEIIIYNSDQSDNRTAIEANIGETYNIDLPSGVDTGYDQVDGFVETWYDQSGNGNDAVQQVSGSQPKIVDGGVLVSSGIEFDGVDDRLTCPSLYSSDISIFNVVTTSNTVNTSNFMRMVHLCDGSDSFQITRCGTTDIGKLASKNTAFQSGTTAFLHGDINGENLISAVTSSTDTDAFIDGSLQSDGSVSIGSGNSTTTTIGARDDLLSTSFFAGSHAEIIIYPSDQSANRVAIETNINNQYDIY